ncbi:hypothetical protein N6H18_00480 [Reichenbachiella agarivorans]|uniref:Uncharacterized protein n=1 Tax=Reichenbachiella agarivorans TaxID=2979464 RepID=A0ABY6CPL8_9BACT|nr:hypothetical protein [Reichenbachiella agarivorans]UXP32451.1 hypothetical protein N6H18_00480 [Reichenbachiella agarivorans]
MYYIVTDELLQQSFEKDRNVILKAAQEVSFADLAQLFVEKTIEKYTELFNPLRLVDDTFQKIMDYPYDNTQEIKGIYDNLCVTYRYKNSDNQLEIIWDGSTQEEKYTKEWSETFLSWVNDLTNNPSFVKAILQLTVFNDGDRNLVFVRNSIKAIINEHFEIKILTRKGVKKVVVLKKKTKKAA